MVLRGIRIPVKAYAKGLGRSSRDGARSAIPPPAIPPSRVLTACLIQQVNGGKQAEVEKIGFLEPPGFRIGLGAIDPVPSSN